MQNPYNNLPRIDGLVCGLNGKIVTILRREGTNILVHHQGAKHLASPDELTVLSHPHNSFCVSAFGRIVFPFRPVPADYENIEEIAHHLSRINRYCGAYDGRECYSDAQHCVNVSTMVPTMDALLHDAPEMYLNDIIAPIKKHLPDYRKLEKLHEHALKEAWKLTLPPIIKKADRSIVYWESKIMKPQITEWLPMPEFGQEGLVLDPLSPNQAKQLFLDRFELLTRKDQ